LEDTDARSSRDLPGRSEKFGVRQDRLNATAKPVASSRTEYLLLYRSERQFFAPAGKQLRPGICGTGIVSSEEAIGISVTCENAILCGLCTPWNPTGN
jgi:hypothetical protein